MRVVRGTCGRRTRARRDSLTGMLIDGSYRIDAKLADGGVGAVCRATHVATGAEGDGDETTWYGATPRQAAFA